MDAWFLWAIILGVILTIAAVQDWRSGSVAGELCLFAGLASGMAMYHLEAYPIVIFVVVTLFIICFSKFELPMFGDADLVPVGMYLAIYLSRRASMAIMLSYPISLLFTLVPCAKIYCRCHGDTWHFGGMQPVPMLPAFAAAWWVSLLGVGVWYLK